MAKVRRLFKDSGMSLHELGIAMGCRPETARQQAWQFMKTSNPRVDMLRRFAKAMGIPLQDLLE